MYPTGDLWLQTYTGKRFYFDGSNSPDNICLEDIAEGLSKECRYGNQCNGFYSVAEHSIHVMRRVRELAYQTPDLPDSVVRSLMRSALMHDASEAYLLDVPNPLKQFLGPVYKQLEADTMEVIAAKYQLKDLDAPIIKQADLEVLAAEAQQVFIGGPIPGWAKNPHKPWPGLRVYSWGPKLAKQRFLTVARLLNIED